MACRGDGVRVGCPRSARVGPDPPAHQGNFFVDAPGYVFPISYEDSGSGVFATALGAVALGFGPLRAATGRRLALGAVVCGLSALLVDIYLY